MKKLISMLLVLTMTLALASTAMAACNLERYDWVEFVKDANSYTAAKASKKTNNVVKAGSVAQVERVCGDYVRLIVNADAMTMCWFKSSALKEITGNRMTHVVWAKGGKGMSTSVSMERIEGIKGYYVKVTGHTNLRSFPGLERKSQGVVEVRPAEDDRLHRRRQPDHDTGQLQLGSGLLQGQAPVGFRQLPQVYAHGQHQICESLHQRWQVRDVYLTDRLPGAEPVLWV